MVQDAGCGRAGAGDSHGGVTGDPVLHGLASIRSAVAELRQHRLWSRSDAASRDGVREGFMVLQSLHAAWLGLVADLDTRPEAVPKARAGTIARTFLRAGLLRTEGQAAADVRAAHALAADADPRTGGMPLLGEMFSEGLISREHVDVALRAMRKLPQRVLSEPVPVPDPPASEESAPGSSSEASTPDAPSAETLSPENPTPENPTPESQIPGSPDADTSAADSSVSDNPTSDDVSGSAPDADAAENATGERRTEMPAGEAVDAFFAHQCQGLNSHESQMLARHLLERLDPDSHDGFDPDAVERRSLTHSTDAGGMVVGRFQLDGVTGAWFATAIEHFAAPDPTREEATEDGGSVHVRDPRTAAQRRADALGLISRLALGSEDAGAAKGGEPPRIVVHAGVEDLLEALHTRQRSDRGDDSPTSGPTASSPSSPGSHASGSHAPGSRAAGSHAAGSRAAGREATDSDRVGADRTGSGLGKSGLVDETDSDLGALGSSDPDPIGRNSDASGLAVSRPTDPGLAGPDAAGPDPADRGLIDADQGGSDLADSGAPASSNVSSDSAASTSSLPLGWSRGPGRGRSASPPSTQPWGSPPSDPAGRLGSRGANCDPLGPIGPRLLGRFACDAILQKALLSSGGALLDLGRDTRTVSRAQRRALNARDRGCVIPGCSAPATWCDAHHVTYWRNGGPTDISNLALVCGRDHTLIHLGIWELVMIEGVPWARPPTWIDPLKRLTRNTFHQRTDQARALGAQLSLMLKPDPNDDLPTWTRPPESPTAERVQPRSPEPRPPEPRDADPTRFRSDSGGVDPARPRSSEPRDAGLAQPQSPDPPDDG